MSDQEPKPITHTPEVTYTPPENGQPSPSPDGPTHEGPTPTQIPEPNADIPVRVPQPTPDGPPLEGPTPTIKQN